MMRRRSLCLGALVGAAGRAAGAGALLSWAGASGAQPQALEAFDASVWAALQQEAGSSGGPWLVVFSATWCAACPGPIAALAADARRKARGARLAVVMLDATPQDAAELLAAPHVRGIDRLYAFSGPEAAIRYAVSPAWRGGVQYLAWLAPGHAPQFVVGAPSEAQLRRWFAAPPTAPRAAPQSSGASMPKVF